MSRPPTRIIRAVTELQRYFEDCVTQTPLALHFTAARAARYLGVSTGTVSAWLYDYRIANERAVAGNPFSFYVIENGVRVKKLIIPSFVISCTERGAESDWFIQSWNGITPAQARWANELTVLYSILTVIKEEIRPMLRNVRAEFLPIASHDLPTARRHVPMHLHKLSHYRAILLDVQRDLSVVLPARLQRIASGMRAEINATLVEIQAVEAAVLAI